MIILVIIYIVSIIGAILTIRYDDIIFDKKPWTLFLVFCPGTNTLLSILELFFLLSVLFDTITQWDLDEKFYRLIRLGRKNE